MKYSKELHDRVEQNLRMFDYPRFDDGDIFALLDEIDRLNVEIKTTDDLLKEATETIGAVVACCTYNDNEDAKIGIYGIDQMAFNKIDRFMTHYTDAVSAGKVSVDVKTSTDNNKGE